MMSDRTDTENGPDWDYLYASAEAQGGYFSTAQAAAARYSSQLLYKYLESGRIVRVRRGIYRLVHFPISEHEDLIVLWLWAEQAGVFSHETALALQDLSDVLPAKVHMTVPLNWEQRRLRVPEGLVLHFADLEEQEWDWLETIMVTSPQRTLRDCIDAYVPPEHVQLAIQQADRRGLVSKDEAMALASRLETTLS